jgi:two-component system, OmpR family, response regulator VicR
MKILVCEDDRMTQQAIIHRLTAEGLDTVIASNGNEAIDLLKKGTIDLLLTDLHMPQLTGLELIEYVRNTMKNNLPIIMLTRVGVEETVLKAFELGADDYITKPFKPDELALRVKKQLLRLKK